MGLSKSVGAELCMTMAFSGVSICRGAFAYGVIPQKSNQSGVIIFLSSLCTLHFRLSICHFTGVHYPPVARILALEGRHERFVPPSRHFLIVLLFFLPDEPYDQE